MGSFLDLPGELRNLIYEIVCDNTLLQSIQRPWDPLPQHERVKTYVSLLRCNRKIHDEVQSLFTKQYAQRLTFYFDHVVQLTAFCLTNQYCALLRDAHFSVRDINIISAPKPTTNGLELLRLIEGQRGFQEKWKNQVGFYRTTPRRQTFLLFAGPPASVQPSWVPEEHGFRYSEHGVWSEDGFKMLEYPMPEDGCQVTAYSWPYHPGSKSGDQGGSSMVLHGRLNDLVLKKSI